MRLLKKNSEINRFLTLLRRRAAGASPEVLASVQSILAEVRARGDKAVAEYTKRFDRHEMPLRIDVAEIERLAESADPGVLQALAESAERIRSFHEHQKEESWAYDKGGILLGQILRPLRRVGVYIPGGKASYPSTVLMNVIPAMVAGVEEVAVCVPTPASEVDPHVMAALRLVGASEVYRIGGAQAIGALAYGTETIEPVDKIVGPGNIYVALAKKTVFGEVDIDMIAGPSEILIIADDSADPSFVAADMLSQAEHDEMASSVAITDSEGLASAVLDELRTQLAMLRRRKIARLSLSKYGAVILVPSLHEATEIADRIAPEHLEIMTRNPERHAAAVRNAGAIFLGRWTPEPLGDYSAGPNHTLPTGGTARFSSPLGVYDFIKRTSLVKFDRKGFLKIAGIVETLAECEGLEAHANTIRIRRKS